MGPLQPGCLTQSRSRPPTSPVKNEDQPLTPSSDESSKSVLATCLPAAQPRGGHRGEWGLGLRAEPPPLAGCETTASSRSSGREGPLGAGSDRSLPGGGGILVEFRGIYRRVSKGGNNQAPAPHTGPEPRDEGCRCEMETRCKRDHDSDGDRTASAHSVIQQTRLLSPRVTRLSGRREFRDARELTVKPDAKSSEGAAAGAPGLAGRRGPRGLWGEGSGSRSLVWGLPSSEFSPAPAPPPLGTCVSSSGEKHGCRPPARGRSPRPCELCIAPTAAPGFR